MANHHPEGQETGLANHEAIGRIGKVYAMHLVTDLWGDVPYSEALRADDPEKPITTPVYDSQEAIYTAMLAELETAVGLLDSSAESFGSEDLIYGGDVTKWEKFANSLRLRLAMRISGVAPAVAQPIVQDLASRPLITSNADNFTLVYLSADPNRNPLFENHQTRNDHAVSNTLVNLLGALGDPRIEVYADPAGTPNPTADYAWCGAAGEPVCHVTFNGELYRGMRNGVNSNAVPTPFSLWSEPGTVFRDQPATPQPLLTAAEVNFLLAEAALNGWGGVAQDYYEAGIRAGFDLWNGANGVNLGSGVQSAYLAQQGVAWGSTPVDGAGDDRELIAEQKWLALYTISPEAYAEYRRTGYPDEIQPSMDATIISTVPGRIPYPDDEQSLNKANRDAAIAAQSAQGVDGTYKGHVWWDR
ncbi:MAG: SusD/RagB family nutrient-binding outer membrane lipoprotein [Longimicrobiales bacterium]